MKKKNSLSFVRFIFVLLKGGSGKGRVVVPLRNVSEMPRNVVKILAVMARGGSVVRRLTGILATSGARAQPPLNHNRHLVTLVPVLLCVAATVTEYTVNTQQPTVNCQVPTVNSQASTVNRQASTVNRQASTVNRQASTVNSQAFNS